MKISTKHFSILKVVNLNSSSHTTKLWEWGIACYLSFLCPETLTGIMARVYGTNTGKSVAGELLGKDWAYYMINSKATWKTFQKSIERGVAEEKTRRDKTRGGREERREEGRREREKRKLELLLISTDHFLYQVLCFQINTVCSIAGCCPCCYGCVSEFPLC